MFLDINECDNLLHTCNSETSTCRNNYGSYSCVCKKGFIKLQGNNTCVGLFQSSKFLF